jgi:hypothetical protein
MRDMISVLKNSIGGRLMKFEKNAAFWFYPRTNSFTIFYDVMEDSKPVVLKGESAPKEIARLLDKFAYKKISIEESWELDDSHDTVVRIILTADERVKNYFERQPLPPKLFKVLSDEVKKELLITSKQFRFIQFLLEGLEEFLISEEELRFLTKREASELIKYLRTLNPTNIPNAALPTP